MVWWHKVTCGFKLVSSISANYILGLSANIYNCQLNILKSNIYLRVLVATFKL